MPATHDLQPAARAVAGLLPGIDDDQLTAPTPCPDYRVRDLLFHLLGLSVAFRDAARKDLGPTTATSSTGMTADLPAQWRSEIPARLGPRPRHRPTVRPRRTQSEGFASIPGGVH